MSDMCEHEWEFIREDVTEKADPVMIFYCKKCTKLQAKRSDNIEIVGDDRW
jgi:hypothetical protein